MTTTPEIQFTLWTRYDLTGVIGNPPRRRRPTTAALPAPATTTAAPAKAPTAARKATPKTTRKPRQAAKPRPSTGRRTTGRNRSQPDSTSTNKQVSAGTEGDNPKPRNRRHIFVHYVFVPQTSSAAVSAWGAKALTFATAPSLVAGHDNEHTVDWYQAKRLTYELQDIADLIPTHWSANPAWSTHWLSSATDDVVLESPVVNEADGAEVSTGRQRFYSKSRDNGASDLTDGREGLIHKNWLYGAYSAEADEDIEGSSDSFPAYEGTGTDSSGWTRQLASGRPDSPGSYWWQHDFFVHDGTVDTAASRENGQWLRGPWYTAANGGFDGRWVQLFDDRPGLEAAIP